MNNKLLSLGRLFLLLTAQAAAAALHASNPIVNINGTQMGQTLTKLTFSGDNVILHFNDGTIDTTDDLASVYIDMQTVTGITSLKAYQSNKITDNCVLLNDIPSGGLVTVYNIAGQKIIQTTTSGNTYSLSLQPLPSGTYIIKTGNNTIKFQKR
jgi:hypothetical protein